MTRVVLLRTGLVLHASGGALPSIARPFRLYMGGPVGTGRQYWSWIHRDDWVAMATWALAHEQIAGPLNLTAPAPVTNSAIAPGCERSSSSCANPGQSPLTWSIESDVALHAYPKTIPRSFPSGVLIRKTGTS